MHGWGSGTILGGVGGSCLVTLNLTWGTKICFWHDVWCGAQSLKTCFTDLFSISHFKDVVVVDHLEFSSVSHQCNINFLRAAHNWETNHFTSLFTLLYSFRVGQGGEDRLCWIPSKKRVFDAKSHYKVLLPYDNTHFPWRSI